MEAITLLTDYVEHLKASEKQLKSLERKAKALAQKQDEADAQRHTLEERITAHSRDAAALQSEHQDLQLVYMKSVYEQDANAQRTAQTRRVEIEAALQEHAQAFEELSTALEALPSFETEAAELASEVEKLSFGNGSVFAANLRDALLKNESDSESRKSAARKQLPPFSEAVRRQVDTAYREEQERKERMNEQERRRVRAKMEENERKARTVTGIRRAE